MTKIVKHRAHLAAFLKSRRARLQPEQFGLPQFPKRRVPGLRREEIAHLAGIGLAWYTWLEQGRDIQVSDEILSRLADILQLNAQERSHLFVLARGSLPLPDEQESEQFVQQETYQAILDAWGICPAYLVNRRLNVVRWNESANRVFDYCANVAQRERNIAWFVFMCPSSRTFFGNWEHAARHCIAALHAKSDQYPDDEWLKELIADLQHGSSEFHAWWLEHDILLTCHSSGAINHPLVGPLSFQVTALVVPSRPDLQVSVHIPLPQDDTAAKLRALMTGGNDFSLTR